MKVRYRVLALSDLEGIFQFLNERSPVGARNVIRAIHDGIAEIAKHPLAAPATSDPALRVKILGRYRYKIFYEIAEDTIDIVHIRHASRRPWIAPRG